MTTKRATARNAEVFDYMVEHLASWHRLPTARELARRFGWASKTSARKHMHRLVQCGLLERTEKGLRLASVQLRRSLATALSVACNDTTPAVPAAKVKRRAPLSGAENLSGSPQDHRRTLLSLTLKGKGSPAQREAAARLRAYGHHAALLMPPDADPSVRHLLAGCGCPTTEVEAVGAALTAARQMAVLVLLLASGSAQQPAGGVACAA